MVDHKPSGWIGTVLQDKWKIESRIARGGVATVFRATHRRGQVAAIKIMHPELARNPDVRSRFLREGYAANKVGHPGVVRVIDDDVTPDGSAYIVMELLEHGELLEDKREKNGGRLPVSEVARICDQVLDVLAAAHEQGIIHRDIKPENIFVLADGTVKVLDFGIAHIKEAAALTGEPTATGLLLGTPEFMSPEQALGKRGHIDAHTDVYAVGATMFTLLSGEAVHVHDNLSNLLMATSNRQARSLSSTKVGREIPREVCALVDKALALEKHRRWPTARAMQEALRKAVPQDYASTPALTPLARPSGFPPPPAATPRGGTKAVSAPPAAPSSPPPPRPAGPAAAAVTPRGGTKAVSAPPAAPSSPPPPRPAGPAAAAATAGVMPAAAPAAASAAAPAKPLSLRPSPIQKVQRIPLPSAPPPAISTAISTVTSRSGGKAAPPATTPGSGVKLPAPKLPAITPGSGVKAASPPPRASRPPPVIEPAPISQRTAVDEPPVPSSEQTAEVSAPPSGPTAVIEPAPVSVPSGAERTVVRPPRDEKAPRDPWTAEFTEGDMEGPTVATTETPAVLSRRAFAQPPDEDETRAQAGAPVRRPAPLVEPPPDEEEAKRTMRLDRPPANAAFDPTPLAPFTPAQQSARGSRGAFAPMSSAPSPALPPPGAPASLPLHTSRPAHPPPPGPPAHPAPREQATPAVHGQPGWLPHQEPPRLAPDEPVKPQAIRIAEIGLAALVVITLSIGGCLLLQNR